MTAATPDKQQIRSEISYRLLTRKDLPALSELIAATRHDGGGEFEIRDHSPAYYDWAYFGNPAGAAVIYGGIHRDRIVTSFAIAPRRIQFGGDVVMCGKTMDMFTHPEYQGLGLISEVTSRVFKETRERGIEMWYVTPSDKSYPIFLNKWKYLEPHRVNYVVKILDYASVLPEVIKPGWAGAVAGSLLNVARRTAGPDRAFEFREERSFGAETDAMWARCSYRVALVRDSAYLTWRYLAGPDKYDITKVYSIGELRGILVTKYTKRRGLKVGEFVDLVTAPDDSAARRAMYLHGLKRFQRDGCAFAQTWAIEDTAQEAEMRAVGIGRRRKKFALLYSPDAPRQEFYDRHAWMLAPGDGNDL